MTIPLAPLTIDRIFVHELAMLPIGTIFAFPSAPTEVRHMAAAREGEKPPATGRGKNRFQPATPIIVQHINGRGVGAIDTLDPKSTVDLFLRDGKPCEAPPCVEEIEAAHEAMRRARVVEWFTHERDNAAELVAEFGQRLAKNISMMSNCDRAIQAAAEHEVFGRCVDALTKEDSKATLASIREYAIGEAVRFARHMSWSSAMSGTFYDRCAAAVWAKIGEDLKLHAG